MALPRNPASTTLPNLYQKHHLRGVSSDAFGREHESDLRQSGSTYVMFESTYPNPQDRSRAVSAAGRLPYHHANRPIRSVSLAFGSLTSDPYVQRP